MDELTYDPFAPLLADEASARAPQDQASNKQSDEIVVTPVPNHANNPTYAAARLYGRRPDAMWIYRDTEGELLFAVARWDESCGKQVRPLSWVRQPDGSEGWSFRHPSTPRPLYNLDRLAARPDAAVVVCEGEKAADAAALIFPDCVATTSVGGAHATGQADWSPLSGRKVLICPDANDPPDRNGRKPGTIYADDVVAAALAQGAAEVVMIDTEALSRLGLNGSSREGPEGWDLADALAEGWPPDHLRALIHDRQDLQRKHEPTFFTSFGAFTMDPVSGLSVEVETRTGVETHFVAAPFEVLGRVRTPDGLRWARLLRWRDDDGRLHTHAVPDADLHGDVKTLAGSLTDMGLNITTGRGRPHLAAYLNSVTCNRRITLVERTGWHDIGGQSVFVLPDRSIGAKANESIVLGSRGATPYEARGSLEEWQVSVGQLVAGQSRLTFAVSAGFAGMLLKPAGLDGGGINFYGASSTGKSTTVEAAASVHGRGGSPGFVRSWRATANALEGAAALHTDTLLVLDELGVIEAKEAASAAYQLAAGTGKGRSARDGSLRSPLTWRTMVLSTGEIRLADKLREGNQRAMAGQAVRLLDVPADAGRGYGVFDHPGDSGSAKDLADRIKQAARAHYGTAGPMFVERLLGRDGETVRAAVLNAIMRFRSEIVPSGADGQVQRAADPFGLIAAAGELACELGIVPWPVGAAYASAAACFQAWLHERGGTEAAEVEEAIARVRRFIEAHGQSRFEETDPQILMSRPVINRAGYRHNKGAHEQWWVLPETWKAEVCAGLDPTRTARILADRGMLIRGSDSFASVKKVGTRSSRVYVLTSKILAGEAER